jgi:hypothetical protein
MWLVAVVPSDCEMIKVRVTLNDAFGVASTGLGVFQ